MRGAHRGVWYSKGTPLMEAELFAATAFAPCTVWPRTVMRGKSRKLTSGPESVPKSARRTEPSPRNPRFAAHLRCVSAKEGLGSQEGTGNHTWCPVPFCPCRWAPTSLGRGDGQSRLQRRAAVSAEGLPSAEGKERRGLCRRLAAKGGALFRERPTGKSLIYLKYFTPFANSG